MSQSDLQGNKRPEVWWPEQKLVSTKLDVCFKSLVKETNNLKEIQDQYYFCRHTKGTREFSKIPSLQVLLKCITSKMNNKVEMKAWETEYKIWENIIKYFSEEFQHWSKLSFITHG